MKQKDLCKKLEQAGFEFVRHGGSHDIYKRGNDEETRVGLNEKRVSCNIYTIE